MRLEARVRLDLLVTVVTVASLGAFAAWSIAASERAQEAAGLGVALQRTNLERGTLRDEYLLHGTERAREQWEHQTAHFEALLARAEEQLGTPEAHALVAALRGDVERTRALFAELVRLGAEPVAPEQAPLHAALREQLWSALLQLQYEQASKVGLLVDAAAGGGAGAGTEGSVLLAVFAVFAVALAAVAANGVAMLSLVRRRLVRLGAAAERIAAGDLAHRIDVRGDDELADLGRAFDAMAARLQRQVEQLEASNKELEAFSYSVSHDLRAPLRYITGFVDILEEEAPAALGEDARRYLRVIADSARKMSRLIDDLLAFSRLGRAPMRSDPVALGPLVDAVVQEVGREADGLEVVWAVGPLPVVVGDAAMLRQVWINLLRNAVKFSRARKPARVEIGAQAGEAGQVRCFVRDNGVGFDMRYAGKLFGVFQRLHGEREFEGNGVGLANVQRIVHRHGGRVWAEAALDAGATFWLSLPAAPAAAVAGAEAGEGRARRAGARAGEAAAEARPSPSP